MDGFPSDRALLNSLSARLGLSDCSGRAGVAALRDVLAKTIPTGSSAKLAALGSGRLVPGSDVDQVISAVLEDTDFSGKPLPSARSWTCWPVAALTGTFIAHLSDWDVSVVVTRALGTVAGELPAPVDFHAVLELRNGSGTYVFDPYFIAGP